MTKFLSLKTKLRYRGAGGDRVIFGVEGWAEMMRGHLTEQADLFVLIVVQVYCLGRRATSQLLMTLLLVVKEKAV